MQIKLNGAPLTVPEDSNLEELIDQRQLPAQRIVVELNGRVVKREVWAQTKLQTEDALEILSFVGGG
jgi:sulfur carrier protein